MTTPHVTQSVNIELLATLVLSVELRECCEVCGASGPWKRPLCGKCAARSLPLIARAYLDLVMSPEIELDAIADRWEGAEDEWGSAETRMPATRFAYGSQVARTTAASPELLARLRRASMTAPRKDATRPSEGR